MKLCIDTAGNEGGEELPLPEKLRPFIQPWATVHYREYFFGNVLIQEYIAGELHYYSWRIEVNTTVTLYPMNTRPVLALHSLSGDVIHCELKGYGEVVIHPSHLQLFYVPKGSNVVQFSPGQYESIHFEIPLQHIDDATDDHPALYELTNKLRQASKKGQPLQAIKMNYVVHYLLTQFLQFSDSGFALFFKKTLFDILVEYFRQLALADRHTALKRSPHHDQLLRLQAYVLAQPNVREHSIKNLSRYVYLSETVLKESFREAFGQTLASFVRQHALQYAHHLIATTDVPLEDIAQQVGYSKLKNFLSPFLRQFGYLPHTLRKK